jgi:hypothetical protein
MLIVLVWLGVVATWWCGAVAGGYFLLDAVRMVP